MGAVGAAVAVAAALNDDDNDGIRRIDDVRESWRRELTNKRECIVVLRILWLMLMCLDVGEFVLCGAIFLARASRWRRHLRTLSFFATFHERHRSNNKAHTQNARDGGKTGQTTSLGHTSCSLFTTNFLFHLMFEPSL